MTIVAASNVKNAAGTRRTRKRKTGLWELRPRAAAGAEPAAATSPTSAPASNSETIRTPSARQPPLPESPVARRVEPAVVGALDVRSHARGVVAVTPDDVRRIFPEELLRR